MLGACASAPSGNQIAPCWERWDAETDIEATIAFRIDHAGVPHRYVHLYDRLDYLDAYCASVNRAIDAPPPEDEGLSWWERSWIGGLLRWPDRQ